MSSFFGLEVPKDLPPLIKVVGPVLSDTYLSLSTKLETFCSAYARTVQVAFETNVILDVPTIRILIQGLATAIAGATINFVIWAIRPVAQEQILLSSTIGPIASDPSLNNTI